MNKSYKWVVKAGSSLVSGNQDGVNIDFISQLASQIDFLRKNNQEVIVISSGAVAKGMDDLGIKERPDQLAILQACAAVGQRGISEIYQNTFQFNDINTILNGNNISIPELVALKENGEYFVSGKLITDNTSILKNEINDYINKTIQNGNTNYCWKISC